MTAAGSVLKELELNRFREQKIVVSSHTPRPLSPEEEQVERVTVLGQGGGLGPERLLHHVAGVSGLTAGEQPQRD